MILISQLIHQNRLMPLFALYYGHEFGHELYSCKVRLEFKFTLSNHYFAMPIAFVDPLNRLLGLIRLSQRNS